MKRSSLRYARRKQAVKTSNARLRTQGLKEQASIHNKSSKSKSLIINQEEKSVDDFPR